MPPMPGPGLMRLSPPDGPKSNRGTSTLYEKELSYGNKPIRRNDSGNPRRTINRAI
jgi:hypothetical protein